jgi:hypothetical protein
VAKKPKSKKPAPTKKPTPSAPAAKAENPYTEAFRRWSEEKAQISVLASEMSIKRSKLRRVLIAMAGGKDGFRKLRNEGAGGSAEPFGGKRAVGRTRETIAADDSKVLRLGRGERTGWTHEWTTTPTGKAPVPIDPEGRRYVKCGPTERADVIFVIGDSIPDARYRLQAGSSQAKKQRKEEAQIERGEAILAKKTERSAKRRKLRGSKKRS